ncbi:hypothetical protein [Lactiplantibacillus plantarum]|uniref:hypothetical protein n=1 Tax=Lactiplantibacillus plantarum TaxID=1590 RepID=UPI0040459FDE
MAGRAQSGIRRSQLGLLAGAVYPGGDVRADRRPGHGGRPHRRHLPGAADRRAGARLAVQRGQRHARADLRPDPGGGGAEPGGARRPGGAAQRPVRWRAPAGLGARAARPGAHAAGHAHGDLRAHGRAGPDRGGRRTRRLVQAAGRPALFRI